MLDVVPRSYSSTGLPALPSMRPSTSAQGGEGMRSASLNIHIPVPNQAEQSLQVGGLADSGGPGLKGEGSGARVQGRGLMNLISSSRFWIGRPALVGLG